MGRDFFREIQVKIGAGRQIPQRDVTRKKKKKGVAKLTDRFGLPEIEAIGGKKTHRHGLEEVK